MDFDFFAQFVIDNYTFLQDEKETQIRELFMAVDVSQTENLTWIGDKLRVHWLEWVRDADEASASKAC